MTVFGVGLIGGSLALALKEEKGVGHVIGMGRSQVNLNHALELNVIDEIGVDIQSVIEQSDLIVLATPVGAMAALLESIEPHLKSTAIITDVGSVKQGVVETAKKALGSKINQFVPGHPIAGRENSGVAAATVDLFENHKVAITPIKETDKDACNQIESMWELVGAEIVSMEVQQHDRVLSITSHLPHMVAYAMVDYFNHSDDREKCYEMVAGGFYDSTRIASSDPVMWRDICEMNKEEVINSINGYQQTLQRLVGLIDTENYTEIEKLFVNAKSARALIKEKRK